MIANMQQRPSWMHGGMGLGMPATGSMPQSMGSLLGRMQAPAMNPYTAMNPWAAAARFSSLMPRLPVPGIPQGVPNSMFGKPTPQMPYTGGMMGSGSGWGQISPQLEQSGAPQGPMSMPTRPGMMPAQQAQNNALAAYTRQPQGPIGM
ncbi:MAG: hypothetical protein ACYC9R_13150 [Nitrosotalea sp.]